MVVGLDSDVKIDLSCELLDILTFNDLPHITTIIETIPYSYLTLARKEFGKG